MVETIIIGLEQMGHLFLNLELEGLSWHKFAVMAAKKVASAINVLTSNGIYSCDAWFDNTAFEVLIADYFTGSVFDSSEESDNDDIGIFLACIIIKL